MKKINIRDIVSLQKNKEALEKDIAGLEERMKEFDIVDMDAKIEASVSAKKETEKKYKDAVKKHVALQARMDLILEVKKHAPVNRVISPKHSKHTSEGVPIIQLSDWHAEQRVDKAEVSGLNEFNLDICTKRSEKCFTTALRLVEIERTATKIDECIVALTGDFISGDIHDDLTSTNFLQPADAILFVQDLIYNGLMFLLKNGEFKKITVICKPGNHSRLTDKQPYSQAVRKTLEWIMYHNLAMLFKVQGTQNIEFIIPESYTYIHGVYDYDLRFCHGTTFRYNGGIGGASVSINRTLLRWNQKEPVYMDFFGHLHSWDATSKFVKNGSLIGYTGMAQKAGYEYQEPIQSFTLIEKTKGLISNRPIYVGA